MLEENEFRTKAKESGEHGIVLVVGGGDGGILNWFHELKSTYSFMC